MESSTVQTSLATSTKIDVFASPLEINEWVQCHLQDSEPVVGFSIIWDQDEVEGEEIITNHRIALFVVALCDKCLLARVHQMADVPEELISLVGSTTAIKAMCGFSSIHLQKLLDRNLTLCQYMDLGDMERKFNKEAPKRDLPTLAEEFFHLPFGGSQAASNWSGPDLSAEQIHWAAATGIVCARVYAANEHRVERMLRRLALPCQEGGCQRYFSTQKSLEHHKQVAHDFPAPVDPNSHSCPRCVKHFRSTTALVQHIEVSHPEHPLPRPDTTDGLTHTFFCGDCEASFSIKEELEQHQQQFKHTSERYVCEVCAKVFSQRSALDMHYDVTHGDNSGEPVHCCCVCHRCFSTVDALYQHQLCVGHSLQEVCNVCAASFDSKEALQGHYNETGHNEFYLCGACPKKFADKDALSKHEHSTGHSGGGRACEMPSFAARRAQANMKRAAVDNARRSKRKPEKEGDSDRSRFGGPHMERRYLSYGGMMSNGDPDWQHPLTMMGQPQFPQFSAVHNGMYGHGLVPSSFPQQHMHVPVSNGLVPGNPLRNMADPNLAMGFPQQSYVSDAYHPGLAQGQHQPLLFGVPSKGPSSMYSAVTPNPVSQYYYTPGPSSDDGMMNVGHSNMVQPPPYPFNSMPQAPLFPQRHPSFSALSAEENGTHTTVMYQGPQKALSCPPPTTADSKVQPLGSGAITVHPSGPSAYPSTRSKMSSDVAIPTAPLADVSNNASVSLQQTAAGAGLRTKPTTTTAFKPRNGAGAAGISPSSTPGAASPASSPPPQRSNSSDARAAAAGWPLRPQAGYPSQPGAGLPRTLPHNRPRHHHYQQNQNLFKSLAPKDPTAQTPPHAGPPGYGIHQMVSPCPSPSLAVYANSQAMHFHGPATPQPHMPADCRPSSHSTPTPQPFLSKSPSCEEFVGSHQPGYISHPMEQPSPFPFPRNIYALQHSAPSSPACHMAHYRNGPSTPTHYPPPTPPPHQPPSPSPQGQPHPPSPHYSLSSIPPPGFSYGPPGGGLHDHSPSPELFTLNTPDHHHPSLTNSPFPGCIQSWPGATEPYDSSSPTPHMTSFYQDLYSPSALVQPFLFATYGPLNTPPKKASTASPPDTPADPAQASTVSTPSKRGMTCTPDGNTSHNPYG